MTLEQRFWAKAIVAGPDDCWPWTGAPSSVGYGKFYVGETTIYAHRFAYEISVGPIPDDLTIDHVCGVRLCVNPAHLEAVTRAENTRRGCDRHRQPECPQGHEFTPENTYRRPDGTRYCRSCHRENAKAAR